MALPVALTGLVMLPGGIVNALTSAVAGRLYDNHGAKWLTRGGFIIAVCGIVLLLTANANSSLAWVIFGHVTLMIGAPLAMSPAQTYGLNSLSGALNADGSAILNTLQQIVGAVCTAVATSLIAVGSQQHAGVAGLTTGTHDGFIFVLLLAIVALITSFAIQAPAQRQDA
jgi:DHA2 family lincomycin resistance protein-like MFS transporter